MVVLRDDHREVQQAVRDFTRRELLPGVIERDRDMLYPREQVRKMAEMGLLGMMVSPDYGGGGMDTLSYVLAVEEIAKVDASAAVIMSVNNSLVCWGLEAFGTPEQKETYLTKLAAGEWLGAFCLSEPEAGSDASRQRTKAVDKGTHYALNGTKNWITNGATSSIHLVMAQSNDSLGSKGINTLIVEANWPGVHVGPKEDKMGIRSSDTTSITYIETKVPRSNRIGQEGFGFSFAMQTLAGGRIGIAAQALGIAAGALDLSVQYASQRYTFGQPIIKHQAVAFKLAEMATQIEAARQMVYRAAIIKDKGLDYDRAGAMAKLMASEVAMKSTTEAVQIHGGYGYVREYHVERMMRDAKITEIYEGTSEIQRLVISRDILAGTRYTATPF